MKPEIKSLFPWFFLLFFTISLAAQNPGPYYQHETEHFVIIYSEAEQDSAIELAGFADRVWQDVGELMDYWPGEKIKVFLQGSSPTTNGYFNSATKAITLFTNAPSSHIFGAGTRRWLELCLIHEYTHYLDITYNLGKASQLGQIMGNYILVIEMLKPQWALEGITTTVESILSGGGRRNSSYWELKIKSLVLAGIIPEYKMADTPSNLDLSEYDYLYLLGSMFVGYLADNWGMETVAEIYKNWSQNPLKGFDKIILEECEAEAEEIWNDMKAFFKEKFQSSLAISERPYFAEAASRPVPSLDGNSIYYISNTRLESLRSIQRREAQTSRMLDDFKIGFFDTDSFCLSDNGLFVCAEIKDPAKDRGLSELYQYENGRAKLISQNALLRHPAYRSGDSQVYCVEMIHSDSRLVAIEIETGTKTVVFDPIRGNIFSPSFSADGKSLVFVFNRDGRQAIGELNLENNAISFFYIDGDGFPYYPFYDALGNINLISDSGGSLALYQLQDDMSLTLILEDRVGVARAAIIQDGSIYYESMRHGWPIILYAGPGETLARDSGIKAKRLGLEELLVSWGIQPATEHNTASLTENDKIYIDFPAMGLLIPSPYLKFDLTDRLFGMDFGAGIINEWVSPLWGNTYSLQAFWLFESRQLDASISASFNLLDRNIGITFKQEYYSLEKNYFIEMQSATLGIELFSLNSFREISRDQLGFTISTIAYFDNLVFAARPFHLGERFPEQSSRMNFAGGTVFSAAYNTLAELYLPNSSYGASTSLAALAGIPGFTDGFLLNGKVNFILPSFIKTGMFTVETSAVYRLQNYNGGILFPVSPAGFGSAYSAFSPDAQLIARLGHIASLCFFERSLVYSIALDLGCSWETAFEKLTDQDYLYLDMSLVFYLGNLSSKIPLSIGIAARLDLNGEEFHFEQDLLPVFDISILY